MPSVPRDRHPDSTLALLADGYRYISRRCDALGTDLFQARILLEKTLCMRGEEAARLFYDPDRFLRKDAAPPRVLKTLFGVGGVQGLDGEAHRHRKEMFMALMTPEKIGHLANLAGEYWKAAIPHWEKRREIVLHAEVREILCCAVCDWAGVPVHPTEVNRRTAELGAMIDSPAALGPLYFRGRRARSKAEQWIGDLVEKVRSGWLPLEEGKALREIALHKDLKRHLMDTRVAAVEVINVLRPTVAIARFVTFVALALEKYPEFRPGPGAEEEELERFVQEVRRFFPFFPLVAARVREDFSWKGYRFPKGTRVLLDLYGTDHDSRSWKDPDVFNPERFREWDESAYNFIPQGGGDHYLNHRCPGEWFAIEVMKVALKTLTRSMNYQVPEQDLRIDFSRMPALPNSGLILRNVRGLSP